MYEQKHEGLLAGLEMEEEEIINPLSQLADRLDLKFQAKIKKVFNLQTFYSDLAPDPRLPRLKSGASK